jgi:hypothetical protein
MITENYEFIIFTYNGQLYLQSDFLKEERVSNIEIINPLGSEIV